MRFSSGKSVLHLDAIEDVMAWRTRDAMDKKLTDPQEEVAKAARGSAPPAAAAHATPMMAQYFEVKARHADFLLFYRMGDFFELFFDDAVKASEALGIQLTRRGKHLGEDIPMCGVPVARADEYLQKLIRKGFRVAVAEQLEDPEAAKKRGPKAVVRRNVVRLVTPGTITEETLLHSDRNNFLTAIAKAGGSPPAYALASLDLSTGDFLLSAASPADLEGECLRLRPAEIVLAENEHDDIVTKAVAAAGASVSQVPAARFQKAKGEQALKETFGVLTLEGLLDFTEAELCAAGALLYYVDLTQIGAKPLLRPPMREARSSQLLIDAATRSALELVRPRNEGAPTLFCAIDRTVTAQGARELASRLLSPSADAHLINARLDAVGELLEDWVLRDRLRTFLKGAPDMGRALCRMKLGRGSPRDLAAVRDGLGVSGKVLALLAQKPTLPAELEKPRSALSALPPALGQNLERALESRPGASVKDGGFIAQGYDKDLDGLRELAGETRKVLARLQADYAAKTGIKTLKIQYNQVFGYFVEVGPAAAQTLTREPLSTTFRHRQTLASAVRFTTDELSELEGRILNATSDALAREAALFEELRAAVLARASEVAGAAAALATLDCLAGLAELAHAQGYVRPIVDNSACFLVEEGRHPALEQALAREGTTFIGNTLRLDGAGEKGPALLVVTGPNMAGKSTYLRQNALIAVLAQMGSFVPAKSANIGVADRLFSRIGASDDLARGRSTFMVEMAETAAILNQATSRSLVILDEIGRGTSTFDGLSIAWAVMEHLHDVIRCRGLLATHYHELTRLGESLQRAGNVRMAVTEWKDTLVFLHSVEEGAALRSYGVEAARLAGVPKRVVARARQVLCELESGKMPGGADELPLFTAARRSVPAGGEAEAGGPPAPHRVLVELANLNIDELSPREALERLYALKAACS